jgi:predicted dehydrogenase
MTKRLAILGTGLAASIHTKALRAVAPSVERWYASRAPERAQAAAARLGGTGSFDSYRAAIADPRVDAVIVAVPPASHLELTLAALDAGKHVLVEKPPFLRSADFDQVEEAARRARRQVLVGENYFYKPLAGLLRETIRRGDLGQVRFIHLNALKRQPTADWRDEAATAGGGALFEGGIHWICLLANIGLTPVRAVAARSGPTNTIERNMAVLLEYAEGAAAHLSYSWDLGGLVNGVRWSAMYGTDGTLRFESNGIVAIGTGRRRRIVIRGLTDLAGYRAMMTDFLGAIDGNRPPVYDLSLARRDLALVEHAYASAASSR